MISKTECSGQPPCQSGQSNIKLNEILQRNGVPTGGGRWTKGLQRWLPSLQRKWTQLSRTWSAAKLRDMTTSTPNSWNLGPRAREWIAIFLTRIISDKILPKSWRITKTVAIPKPEKEPKMASSYRPISILSMCYKLLERIILHRISPTVDEILNIEQAGFRTGRSTHDHVLPIPLTSKMAINEEIKKELSSWTWLPHTTLCVAQRYVSETIQRSTMLGRQCHLTA